MLRNCRFASATADLATVSPIVAAPAEVVPIATAFLRVRDFFEALRRRRRRPPGGPGGPEKPDEEQASCRSIVSVA